MQSFLIPFLSIALAELGDKTQWAVMLLAAKTKKHGELFWGALLGFFVVDGTAILAGHWLLRWIPVRVIHIFSGILFVLFGIFGLREKPAESASLKSKKEQNPFMLGFSAICLAEWGDKTQVAAGLFATRYSWPGVLGGTMAALALLSLMAIYAGKFLKERIKPALLHKIAAVLFILIGISFFVF